MRLRRKLEHQGSWWAQRQDGRWIRWNLRSNDWEERPEAPFPDEGDPPDRDPLTGLPITPVDRWWNRRFPPHSTARLVFLLCALPVVSAAHALFERVTGRDVSLGFHAFITVMAGILLTLLWFSGVLKGFHEPDPASARGCSDDPPPELRGNPRRPWRGFVVALPFTLAATVVFLAASMGLHETFTGPAMLVAVVFSIVAALIVALRHSIWSAVLISLMIGYGGAVVLQLFSIFSGTESWFTTTWLLASLLAFAWVAPTWWQWRHGWPWGTRHRRPDAPRDHKASGAEPPLWVIMAATLIMVIGSAIYFSLTT